MPTTAEAKLCMYYMHTVSRIRTAANCQHFAYAAVRLGSRMTLQCTQLRYNLLNVTQSDHLAESTHHCSDCHMKRAVVKP